MQRRLLVVVALVIGMAALVWLIVLFVTPPTRFVYGLAAIGPDSAILLTQRHDNDSLALRSENDFRFWLEHVNAVGTVAWSREVTPLEPIEWGGFSGVAANDDLVVVLAVRYPDRVVGPVGREDDPDQVVAAFARGDGQPRWERVIGKGESRHFGPMLHFDGARLYVAHSVVEAANGRDLRAVTTLRLADGATLWTSRQVPYREVSLLAPNRLLLSELEAVVEIDGATGATTRRYDGHRLACVTPAWVVRMHDGSIVVSARQADDPGRRIQLPEFLSDGVVCGERDDDLVVNTGFHAGLARFDPISGAVRWRLAFEGSWTLDATETRDGRLPRFLPTVSYGTRLKGEAYSRQIVVVDLDRGVIVARERVDAHADDFHAFVTDDHAFIASATSHLFALDSRSGRLSTVHRFIGLNLFEVRAEDYRFGQLWAAGVGWTRPSELPTAIVELAQPVTFRVNGATTAVETSARGWEEARHE